MRRLHRTCLLRLDAQKVKTELAWSAERVALWVTVIFNVTLLFMMHCSSPEKK